MQTYPIYLVLDVSASMGPVMRDLNQAIRTIVDSIKASPILGDVVQLGVISFSNDAYVQMSLTNVWEAGSLPTLYVEGATAYGPAFRLLKNVIDGDIARLKSAGTQVYRPLVLFLTDGSPIDREQWRTELLSLKEDRLRPEIIAFGIGAIDPEPLLEIASRPSSAFLSDPGVSLSTAIADFGEFVITLLRPLTETVQSGAPRAVVPYPASFTTVPFDPSG